MWEDPIVAEIQRNREKLAAQYNYSVESMFADLRLRQAALGSRLMHQKEQTIPSDQANEGGSASYPPAPAA